MSTKLTFWGCVDLPNIWLDLPVVYSTLEDNIILRLIFVNFEADICQISKWKNII